MHHTPRALREEEEEEQNRSPIQAGGGEGGQTILRSRKYIHCQFVQLTIGRFGFFPRGLEAGASAIGDGICFNLLLRLELNWGMYSIRSVGLMICFAGVRLCSI